MKRDNLGLLVSEIWPDEGRGFYSNRGDSMANTSRLFHLYDILCKPRDPVMSHFISPTGYLRHPSDQMPLDWRESDSSTDQCLPFYIAAETTLQKQMFERIKSWHWRTGNGDLVSPTFYGILAKSKWITDISLAGQALISCAPIRWNDEKKRLTWEPNASGDLLNWFHAAAYTKSWALKLISRERFMSAVGRYFQNEPNSQWLVDLYIEAARRVWG